MKKGPASDDRAFSFVIRLDSSGWRTPADFYSALLPQLGAPSWHGRNLDALFDSLSGGINRVEPPIRIELRGPRVSKAMWPPF